MALLIFKPFVWIKEKERKKERKKKHIKHIKDIFKYKLAYNIINKKEVEKMNCRILVKTIFNNNSEEHIFKDINKQFNPKDVFNNSKLEDKYDFSVWWFE